jgi:hypothetical protein
MTLRDSSRKLSELERAHLQATSEDDAWQPILIIPYGHKPTEQELVEAIKLANKQARKRGMKFAAYAEIEPKGEPAKG